MAYVRPVHGDPFADGSATDLTVVLGALTDGVESFAVNVLDYGALPDRRIDAGAPATPAAGGTDNTAAFNSALAALTSLATKDPARWYEVTTTARPTLFIPAGRYNIGDLDPITVPGLRIVGAGRDATTLFHTGTGGAFTFGTFTTTPASAYEGTAYNVAFEDLGIVQAAQWVGGSGWGTEGSRTARAIVDNFNGGFYLHRVRVTGFQYGFLGQAGSDFTQVVDCEFNRCDVGVYLGPSSQQYRLTGSAFNSCRESLVLSGAKQGSVQNCSFIDAIETHVAIESNTTTRTGVALSGSDVYSLTIGNCWFEDAANGSENRVVKEHVKFSSNNSGTPKNVLLHDNYVVAGGTLATKRAFVRIVQGTRIVVERTCHLGILDYEVSQPVGSFTLVTVRNSITVDGYTPPKRWGLNDDTEATSGWVGARYEDASASLKQTIGTTYGLETHYLSGTLRTGRAATGSRPSAATVGDGAMFYDTTLSKPIWSNGSVWKDATGATV